MSLNLTRRQKKERQAYADQVFTDRSEYFFYRDLRTMILDMLSSDNRKSMNIATKRFLNICGRMIEKCRQDNRNCDWKCYGGVLIMEMLRDSEQFQKEYKIIRAFLEGCINNCDKKTNPAENVMTDEEIQFVLLKKPDFIERCAKPSEAAQIVACKHAPRAIRFIDEPSEYIVDFVTDRNIKNILLVKPRFRTLKSEIAALNADVLNLQQVNKTRLIENDYNAGIWTEDELIKLVTKVEGQSGHLSPDELEMFRLNAAGWGKVCVIKYMHHPSNAAKEKAVQTHPNRIDDISHQYPGLHKMALFYGFMMDCRNLYNWPRRTILTLPEIHGKLANPDAESHQIYRYLRGLYDNLQNITHLEYQNTQVQLGCLYLAYTKKIDINRIFALFNNPSQDVRNVYSHLLEQQSGALYLERNRQRGNICASIGGHKK